MLRPTPQEEVAPGFQAPVLAQLSQSFQLGTPALMAPVVGTLSITVLLGTQKRMGYKATI